MKIEIGNYPDSSEEQRKVDIHIDHWDTWNMDNTLCLIINPMLKQLKETKSGYGGTNKEDVPEEFYSDYDECGFSEKAYSWVLDEIIWATDPQWENIYDNLHNSIEESMEHWERRKNAMILFGKYFFTFWD